MRRPAVAWEFDESAAPADGQLYAFANLSSLQTPQRSKQQVSLL